MTRIYYNNLSIDDATETIDIYKDCPYDEVPADEVDDYVEEKEDWGEWDCWAIPDITNYKVIFHI